MLRKRVIFQQKKEVEPQTSLLGSSYNHILSVINSPHTPKDRPYYITLNEGTPQQQMFLIQPPANQQVGLANKTDSGVLPVNQNMGVANVSASQVGGTNKDRKENILVSQNVGVVSNSENEVLPHKRNDVAADDKKESSVAMNKCANNIVNKLFKFCNIPATASSDQKDNISLVQESQGQTKDKAVNKSRPESPNLFDNNTEESETFGNGTNDISLIKNIKQESVSTEDSKKENNAIKSENCHQTTMRKPIFKKGTAVTVKEEEETQPKCERDEDDFKVRRSSIGSVLCKSVEEDKNENDEAENMDFDEPLRTRRRTRGVKRKSLSRSKGKKRSKGVDFLDNIETSKENEVLLQLL